MRAWPTWVVGIAIVAVAAGAAAGGLTMVGTDGGAVDAISALPGSTGAMTPALPMPVPSTTTAANPAPVPGDPGGLGVAGKVAAGPATAPAIGRRPAATALTTVPAAPVASASLASGPPPAAPGTYKYRQAGSLAGTPAEGTLVVAPATAAGTQTWVRAVGGAVAASTSVMLFNPSGAYLVAPGGTVAGSQASCSFATPLAWPPWPMTVGRTVTGHATCTGSVSSYDVTERVTGSTPLPLDGRAVDATVVANTIVIAGTANGSRFNVTLEETDYYAPTSRVPVQTKTHLSGTVIGIPVTTDRTDTLESATPS